jgi:hypothetical protein
MCGDDGADASATARAVADEVIPVKKLDVSARPFVVLLGAAGLLAGCAGVGTSSSWQATCAPGDYARQSLNDWFRVNWEVTTGRHGPQIEGYVYNDYWATAERMLLAVERLDASGQVAACSTTWVGGTVPSDYRAYFVAAVPDAGATYRVRIVTFGWASKGGS